MKKLKLNYLVIPLIAVFVSVFGSWLTDTGMDWYKTISLPEFTPPGSFIGIVWTIIFILTTISVLVVWNKFERNKIFWIIVVLFLANAFLNVFWSFLFFNQHLIGWSLIEMNILNLTTILLIIFIWPKSKFASVLLMPYAGWVAFATYLAYNIWLLNK